jgi:hypothetical protein
VTTGYDRRKTFRSYGAMPFRESIEYHSSLPDYFTKRHPFYWRMMKAIGTNHGVLDISTIDASDCRVHATWFLSQVTERFTDEQSPAALTDHTSSSSLLCHTYLRFTWIQQHRLRRQSAPSSAIVPGFPSMFRTRPWTGRRSGTDAVPGILR